MKFAKNAFTDIKIFIPRHNILSANAVNRNFLIIINNPDEYINSLNNKQDRKIAKQYMKKFETPILIPISTCKETAGEIAERVNNILQ